VLRSPRTRWTPTAAKSAPVGIRQANRDTVRAFLARYADVPTVVAVEAMTGWRFVAEECALAGIDVKLAEPAERGRARIASGARRPTSSTLGCCASC
jgi:hypothetical protein